MTDHSSRRGTRREFIRDIAIGASGLVIVPGLVGACTRKLGRSEPVGWYLVPHILALI
jgi:hypothetical protein